MTAKSQCLCGAVSITAELNPDFTVCHCSSCQRWSGGPLMMSPCGQQVRFDGQSYIQEYDSSAWAVRAFCRQCGTHLYSRFKQDNRYSLPVGLFADKPFNMTMQYYIDKKPAHYQFANDTDTLTSEQIAALFAPSDES